LSTLRKRRSPEAARSLILDAAEARLQQFGIEGLNVVGVAAAAGLSHANIIHHFGNTAGMRNALEERMTQALLTDLLTALEADAEPRAILAAVFHAMAGGGHAKLLAWQALNSAEDTGVDPALAELFRELIQRTAQRFGIPDPHQLRNSLLLIAAAAIGLGVSGNVLIESLGVEEMDNENFADWLTSILITDNN
jgi:AcrR family transcriptional regulator